MIVVPAEHIEPCLAQHADHTLVNAIKGGDRQAFASLYDLYSSAVYALCLKSCADQPRAGRLLEAVFHRLWQTRASLSCPVDGILPLLYVFVLAGK